MAVGGIYSVESKLFLRIVFHIWSKVQNKPICCIPKEASRREGKNHAERIQNHKI